MQLHLQRPLPSQSQNYFVSTLRGIKAHRPWGVRRWALIPRSGKKNAKGKQRIWFWYAILTHPQSHPHTHPHTHTHTHTQYIISILTYVLFLCMVQEGGIWDYTIIFIQFIVLRFQGSHNLNKYNDLLMFLRVAVVSHFPTSPTNPRQAGAPSSGTSEKGPCWS